MNCLIVSGGQPPSKNLLVNHIKQSALIIAVDGAAALFKRFALVPHVLIGDFDSVDDATVQHIEAKGAKIVRLVPEKNETDTQAAIDWAIDAGASQIVLLGATGKRMDHTLGNIAMLLRAYRAGVSCRIIDSKNELFIAGDEYDLYGRTGQTISILPLESDIHVTATNLKYPLENLALCSDASRGISNIIQKSPAHLSISGGLALIVKILGKA